MLGIYLAASTFARKPNSCRKIRTKNTIETTHLNIWLKKKNFVWKGKRFISSTDQIHLLGPKRLAPIPAESYSHWSLDITPSEWCGGQTSDNEKDVVSDEHDSFASLGTNQQGDVKQDKL